MATNCIGGMARRDFLRAGFGSLAIGAAGALGRAPAWAQSAANAAPGRERILVVLELSGVRRKVRHRDYRHAPISTRCSPPLRIAAFTGRAALPARLACHGTAPGEAGCSQNGDP